MQFKNLEQKATHMDKTNKQKLFTLWSAVCRNRVSMRIRKFPLEIKNLGERQDIYASVLRPRTSSTIKINSHHLKSG